MGRVVYRKNLTSDSMQDGFDHGTGVASIAVAVAPRCNLLNIKVLDNRGEGSEEDVVMGIDEVLSLHDEESEYAPWVINLSLGGLDDNNPYNPLRVACRAAIDRGIWIIAAAGNEGPDGSTIMSPACERYVAAIGSARYDPFMVSDFSSRGPTEEGLIKPDALSFGEDIVVASSVSDTAAIAKSGTSFSVPFTSAMAVLYHEGVLKWHGVQFPGEVPPGIYPEITGLISIQELIDVYLPGICVKPENAFAGKDCDYGYGLPFGPLVSQAITSRQAVDIYGMVTAVAAIGLLGMVVRSV